MVQKSLKDDLANCLISFNQRVLVTDLMDDYELPFAEVENYVKSHIEEEEKTSKMKYEKRFLINGQEETSGTEIYTVVSQDQVAQWLRKLKESESKLYSVEMVGGSKSAAREVKPLRFCTIGHKDSKKPINVEEVVEKKTPAPEPKIAKKPLKEPEPAVVKTVKNESPKKSIAVTKKQNDKKEKKSSPTEDKPKKKPLKDKDQIIKKPASPKKVNDFFKKSTKEATSSITKAHAKKLSANSSMQLFEDEEQVEAKIEVDSSDEEEKLDALRRELTSNDCDGEEKHASGGPKRRRILDSDDEDEQPQAKQEKTTAPIEVKDDTVSLNKSETYLDEDGFVLTIKPKKNAPTSNGNQSKQKSPTVKKSSPVKAKPKSPKKKPPPKTKQGNIMSFFSKK